jgi:hypothetical protein
MLPSLIRQIQSLIALHRCSRRFGGARLRAFAHWIFRRRMLQKGAEDDYSTAKNSQALRYLRFVRG